MTAAARRPGGSPAELWLRTALDPDHLLWPFALDAVFDPEHPDRTSRARKLCSFLEFLRERNVDPLDATNEDLAAWLAPSVGSKRASDRDVVRRVYRPAARRLHILGVKDPTAGGPYYRAGARADRRLSQQEMVLLVQTIATSIEDERVGLTARRDLVIVALVMMGIHDLGVLASLTWADVNVASDAPAIRTGGEWQAMPRQVAETVLAFQRALSARGVVVSGADALMPVLGNRIFHNWLGDERDVLLRPAPGTVRSAISRRLGAAGLREIRDYTYASSAWLVRGSPAEVDAALASKTPTRIRMHHPRALRHGMSRMNSSTMAA